MRILRLLGALLALVTVGCASSGDAQPPQEAALTQRPDMTRFDVRWKDDTVVLDDATARAVYDPAASRLGEDLLVLHDAPVVHALHEGQHLLVPQVGLFKIKAVDRAAATMRVKTEPGSLLDAATDGELAWDVAVALPAEKAIALTPDDAELVWEATTSDGKTFRVKVTPANPGGRTGVRLELEGRFKDDDGPQENEAAVTLTGTVAFRTAGTFQFAHGDPLHFEFNARDVRLEAQLAVSGSSTTLLPLNLIDYPSKLAVPFAVGPIPMFVAIGGAVRLGASLSTGTSAAVRGRVGYTGDLGVVVDHGRISRPTATGTPDVTLEAEPNLQTAAMIGAELATPRLEVGVGIPNLDRIAGASLYVDLRATLAAEYRIDHLRGGSCFDTTMKLGAYFGGQAHFFGLRFSAETPIRELVRHPVRRGACEEDGGTDG